MVALLGVVYDVARGKEYYGPGGGYSFFAGHDCEIYDLTLTVMARKSDWDEHLTNVSSDAQELGCEDIGAFDRACRYFITPRNAKLGIKFDMDADVDIDPAVQSDLDALQQIALDLCPSPSEDEDPVKRWIGREVKRFIEEAHIHLPVLQI